MSADMEALGLLRKSAGDDVEPWMWDLIEKQVADHGIDGLTPTAYAVLEGVVAKHGNHNQLSHGHGGGATPGRVDTAKRMKNARDALRGGDPVVVATTGGKRSATYVQRNGNGTHTVKTNDNITMKVKDKHIAPEHLRAELADVNPPSLLTGLYS